MVKVLLFLMLKVTVVQLTQMMLQENETGPADGLNTGH